MMIRNELKIKDAQRLSQRTFSKQSKTKRSGTISEQQLEKRSEKPAQHVPIGLTSYINLEECFCYQELQTKGQLPGARKGMQMLNLDRSRVMMMGGIGVEVYNDLKVYDFATKEWKH